MSLSFQDSPGAKLICVVEGGGNNGKNRNIYISTKTDANNADNEEADPFYYLTDKWFHEQKNDLKTTEINRLQHAIIRKKPPDDPILEQIYNHAIEYLQKKQGTEISIVKGIIRPSSRDPFIHAYACGPTGSGKSFWLKNFVLQLRKKKVRYGKKIKKPKVYIFSVLEKDESLDEVKPIRIKIDDKLIFNPIQLKELANCIVIFDDIETFKDKDLKHAVSNLRDQCLSEGRHHNIKTLVTNHQPTNYTKTREILLECSYITFFPRSGGLSGIIRLLKNYIGLNKQQIDRIMKLPSRWVTIYNRYPLTCMYESGVYFLSDASLPPIIDKEPKGGKVIESESDTESDSESDSEEEGGYD